MAKLKKTYQQSLLNQNKYSYKSQFLTNNNRANIENKEKDIK